MAAPYRAPRQRNKHRSQHPTGAPEVKRTEPTIKELKARQPYGVDEFNATFYTPLDALELLTFMPLGIQEEKDRLFFVMLSKALPDPPQRFTTNTDGILTIEPSDGSHLQYYKIKSYQQRPHKRVGVMIATEQDPVDIV